MKILSFKTISTIILVTLMNNLFSQAIINQSNLWKKYGISTIEAHRIKIDTSQTLDTILIKKASINKYGKFHTIFIMPDKTFGYTIDFFYKKDTILTQVDRFDNLDNSLVDAEKYTYDLLKRKKKKMEFDKYDKIKKSYTYFFKKDELRIQYSINKFHRSSTANKCIYYYEHDYDKNLVTKRNCYSKNSTTKSLSYSHHYYYDSKNNLVEEYRTHSMQPTYNRILNYYDDQNRITSIEKDHIGFVGDTNALGEFYGMEDIYKSLFFKKKHFYNEKGLVQKIEYYIKNELISWVIFKYK